MMVPRFLLALCCVSGLLTVVSGTGWAQTSYLDRLVAALHNPDPSRRLAGVTRLGEMELTPALRDELVELMGDPDVTVRLKVVAVLSAQPRIPLRALQLAFAQLSHPLRDYRQALLGFIDYCGGAKAFPDEMLTAIGDAVIPAEMRVQLAQRMVGPSDAEIARRALRVASRSAELSVRHTAVSQYQLRADIAYDKVMALVPVLLALPVEDDGFAVSIATAILSNVQPPREAVNAVTAAYKAFDPVVRARAAQLASVALRRWGMGERPYALLDDPSPRVRLWAHIALEREGERLDQAVPRYIAALDSSIISDRMAAIDALKGHSQDGVAAAPKLLALSRGTDRDLALAAGKAYAQVAPASGQTVENLMRMLADSDRDTRYYAIIALGRMGEYARPAVPRLVELLNRQADDNRNERQNILTVLGSLSRWAEAAIPAIRTIAEDTSEYALHTAAITTLAQFPRTPANQALFTKLIADAIPSVQSTALRAVRNGSNLPDESVPAVLTALHSKSPVVREAAAQALSGTQSQFAVVAEALLRCLDDPADSVRIQAISAFSNNSGLRDYRPPVTTLINFLGDASANFQGPLLNLMQDKDLTADQLALVKPLALSGKPEVSSSAMRVWIRTAKRDGAVLDDLLAHLDKVGDSLPAGIYSTLSEVRIGSKDRSVDAFLVAKLDSPNAATVAAALQALGNRWDRLTFNDELAAKVVALLRSRPTRDVRQAAMNLIGKFPRLDADATFPLLVDMLTADDSNLRSGARNAFSNFTSWTPAMVATLVDQAASASPNARPDIIAILARADARAAAPLISAFVDSAESEDALRMILTTLSSNQGSTSAILPQLVRIARDEHHSQDLRSAAIRAMGGAGQKALEIMPVLLDFFAQRDFTASAASALSSLGPVAVGAVPALREGLARGEVWTVSQTLSTLGSIGHGAVAAVPDILPFLRPNQSPNLRRSAINALRAIAPPSREVALTLVPLIADQDSFIARYAVAAISAIGTNLPENGRTPARRDLDALLAAVAQQESIYRTGLQETLYGVRQKLEPTAWETVVENASDVVRGSKVVQSVVLVFLAYVSWLLFLGLLWLAAPLTVHRLARFTRSNSFGGATNMLMPFLFLYHFEATKRVIDRWVKHNLATLRQRCADSFSKNAAYMVLPVRLKDGSCVLDAALMRRLLAPEQPVLAVLGEGGIGKTTLAAHVARNLLGIDTPHLFDHAVVPVLLDVGLTGETLVETLRQKLAALSGEELGTPFLLAMLRSRRVFTIVDALSELPPANQRKLVNEMEAYPEGGFIITSRLADPLGLLRFTEVRLSVLQSSMLAEFVDFRLQLRKQDQAIDQIKRYEACIKIVHLMGDRPTTPLLAGMYIDLFGDAVLGGESDDLPQTVPDLILSFINTMNKQVHGDEVSEWKVRQAMKVVARCCIEPGYFPQRGIEEELGAVLEKAALPDVDYLVNNTFLVRLAPRHVAIRHDTVCEYLAAMAIVEDCEAAPFQWNVVLEQIRNKADEYSNVSGFVRALRDVITCYVEAPARAIELLEQLPAAAGRLS